MAPVNVEKDFEINMKQIVTDLKKDTRKLVFEAKPFSSFLPIFQQIFFYLLHFNSRKKNSFICSMNIL